MGNIDFSMRTLILSVRPIKVIVNHLVSDVLQVLLDQLSGHLSKTLNRSLSSKHDCYFFSCKRARFSFIYCHVSPERVPLGFLCTDSGLLNPS